MPHLFLFFEQTSLIEEKMYMVVLRAIGNLVARLYQEILFLISKFFKQVATLKIALKV